jgi:hypothetical protein
LNYSAENNKCCTLAVDVRLVSRLEGKLRSLGMRIGSFPPLSFFIIF